MRTLAVLGMIITASLLGAIGNTFFKFGTNKLGPIPPHRFLDVSYVLRYLFTPSIFAGLVIIFLGRFFMGSPLSVLGVTQVFLIVTVLSLVFTLILEVLLFKQRYDVWTYVGVFIGLVSVALISRGMGFS